MKKIRTIIVNVLLASVWAWFMYVNLTAYFETGRFTLLLFTMAQSEFVILLLIRKAPLAVTKNWHDYAIAIAGTFVTLMFEPSSAVVFGTIPSIAERIGDVFIYMAIVLEIIGYVSLNTSAGIVPANRGVKTEGMYALMRHPVYASYLLLYAGYVIGNPSPFNLVIMFFAAAFQAVRIEKEEAILSEDPAYVLYAQKVPWKLIPGVY